MGDSVVNLATSPSARVGLREQLADQSTVLVGHSGVGKSTLVNAVFGRDVAATGVGSPVTKGLVYYRMPDGFLGVYDSEGFETGTAGDSIVNGLRRIVADHRARPINEQIHAAWYLVRWSDRRFEPAQERFVHLLGGQRQVSNPGTARGGDGIGHGRRHPGAGELAGHLGPERARSGFRLHQPRPDG